MGLARFRKRASNLTQKKNSKKLYVIRNRENHYEFLHYIGTTKSEEEVYSFYPYLCSAIVLTLEAAKALIQNDERLEAFDAELAFKYQKKRADFRDAVYIRQKETDKYIHFVDMAPDGAYMYDLIKGYEKARTWPRPLAEEYVNEFPERNLEIIPLVDVLNQSNASKDNKSKN